MHRRDLLKKSLIIGGGLGSTIGSTTTRYWADNSSKIASNPFQLGIASGDVTADSVILWTRLVTRPEDSDGGMGEKVAPVTWQIAQDHSMQHVIQQGEQYAHPMLAHSVHIDVQGLKPGTEYWYRFSVDGHTSPVGRTKTLPAGADVTTRFVTTSCQNYTHGYFVAYRHMVADAPDFVIHLGDYIYDTSFGETFRRHDSEEAPQSVSQFRRRHALYKTDQDLQHAHSQLPFFTVLDNHDAIEDNDPSLYSVRAAAYQAWYEHMPVRGFDFKSPNSFDMARVIELGELMQINLLDTRQYRDKKDLCRDNIEKAVGFGNYRERCDTLFDEQRTMLGHVQEEQLYRSIRGNSATWNVVASSVPVLPFRVQVDGDQYGYIGSWDAYPANRRRLAEAFEQAQTGQAVVLSGDLHSFWAMNGHRIQSPEDHVPAIELVSSSISANWPKPLSEPISRSLNDNPHVDYYEGSKRGYLLHDVDVSEWRSRYRAVEDSTSLDASVRDIRRYRLPRGSKELQGVSLDEKF